MNELAYDFDGVQFILQQKSSDNEGFELVTNSQEFEFINREPHGRLRSGVKTHLFAPLNLARV